MHCLMGVQYDNCLLVFNRFTADVVSTLETGFRHMTAIYFTIKPSITNTNKPHDICVPLGETTCTLRVTAPPQSGLQSQPPLLHYRSPPTSSSIYDLPYSYSPRSLRLGNLSLMRSSNKKFVNPFVKLICLVGVRCVTLLLCKFSQVVLRFKLPKPMRIKLPIAWLFNK